MWPSASVPRDIWFTMTFWSTKRCMCVSVCIHMHVHAHIHIHIRIQTHIRIHIYVYIYKYICINLCHAYKPVNLHVQEFKAAARRLVHQLLPGSGHARALSREVSNGLSLGVPAKEVLAQTLIKVSLSLILSIPYYGLLLSASLPLLPPPRPPLPPLLHSASCRYRLPCML